MDIKKELAKAIFSNDIIEVKQTLLDIYADYKLEDTMKVCVVDGLPLILVRNFNEVKSMLLENEWNYIPAIKLLRDKEQLGLREAKNIVDWIKKSLNL